MMAMTIDASSGDFKDDLPWAGDVADPVDQSAVGRQRPRLEAGVAGTEVVVAHGVHRAGQVAASQRAEGHERDPVVAAPADHVLRRGAAAGCKPDLLHCNKIGCCL